MGIVGAWIDSLPAEGVERDAIITHPDPTYSGSRYWSPDRDCGCLVGAVVDALVGGAGHELRGEPFSQLCGVWPASQRMGAVHAGLRFPELARRFTPERIWRLVKARAARPHRPLLPAAVPQSETAGVAEVSHA